MLIAYLWANKSTPMLCKTLFEIFLFCSNKTVELSNIFSRLPHKYAKKNVQTFFSSTIAKKCLNNVKQLLFI